MHTGQNGVPFLQPGELVSSIGHFAKLFADAGCYIASIPTYVGGHMAMGFATDDAILRVHTPEGDEDPYPVFTPAEGA